MFSTSKMKNKRNSPSSPEIINLGSTQKMRNEKNQNVKYVSQFDLQASHLRKSHKSSRSQDDDLTPQQDLNNGDQIKIEPNKIEFQTEYESSNHNRFFVDQNGESVDIKNF